MCRLQGMRCRMATMMLGCYLLTIVMMLTHGQAYHFSQGWLPGGKRSRPSVADDSTDRLARLLRGDYDLRKTATDIGSSVDNSRPRSRRIIAISTPDQHRSRLLRLVCCGAAHRDNESSCAWSE